MVKRNIHGFTPQGEPRLVRFGCLYRRHPNRRLPAPPRNLLRFLWRRAAAQEAQSGVAILQITQAADPASATLPRPGPFGCDIDLERCLVLRCPASSNETYEISPLQQAGEASSHSSGATAPRTSHSDGRPLYSIAAAG